MTDIEQEFSRAIRFAKQPRPAAMLATLGLSNAVQWGAALIDWYGVERRSYEPAHDDAFHPWALIAPVVEDGELVDLAAIELPSQHVGLRLGVGHGLGLDAVERARWTDDKPLLLVATPLAWLRHPIGSIYLFHLSDVDVALDGVARIACQTVELAERVHSLVRPSRRPAVLAPSP